MSEPVAPTPRLGHRPAVETARLVSSYILALLFGTPVRGLAKNPNVEGDLSGFDEPSLQLVIDEGQRQLAEQSDRFRHTTDRAQLVVTVSLVALPFFVATSDLVRKTHGVTRLVAAGLEVFGGLAIVLGLLASASVVVVKATFSAIDTTQITGWKPPILRELAADYAKTVRVGEETIADRITVFRQATRFLVWGATLTTVAALLGV